ncbi:ABC-2 transporter permease [Hathewaya limosa]|uniref:ABC-2 family transporter protein n=1 Tax=Hathewaya limosa TaxID=1536 RepID=A0ABU0JVI5_HATLI|nr:ABC-2 transporter permease [Hathewaya limosa]MDQ0480069.1 hypothetical protein [Hathewaya limosa]
MILKYIQFHYNFFLKSIKIWSIMLVVLFFLFLKLPMDAIISLLEMILFFVLSIPVYQDNSKFKGQTMFGILPIKRKDIILGQYIIPLINMAIFIGVYALVYIALGKQKNVLNNGHLEIVLIVSMINISLLLPLYASSISFTVKVGFQSILIGILSGGFYKIKSLEGVLLNHFNMLVLTICVIYSISYICSRYIFNNREFH